MSECGKKSCVGSVCVKPAGHTEPHKSRYGAVWTDESNRAYGDSIANSMRGRRD